MVTISGHATHTSHRRPLLVAALVSLIAVVASSCVLTGSWTALATPNPASAGIDAELLDVSCPTRDFCMAIGVAWSDDPGSPIVRTWDGTTWTPLPFEPFVGDPDNLFEVTSVSCGTSTSCAVGWTLLAGDEPPMFSVWDGSTWTQPPFPTVYDPLRAEVACAPDGSCLLATDQSPTTVWDGDTFTSFTFEDGVGGVLTPALVDLSCLAADDCVGITDTEDHVVRWNGSTWADPWWGVALPGSPGPVAYHSISCTATDRCVVVGDRNDPTAGLVPIAAVGDGTTWTAAEVPVAKGSLRSVSCATSNGCVAVGTVWVQGMGDRPVAVAGTGTSWYRVEDPPAPSGARYAAIGCGVGDRCVAVGSSTPAGAAVPLSSAFDWQPKP